MNVWVEIAAVAALWWWRSSSAATPVAPIVTGGNGSGITPGGPGDTIVGLPIGEVIEPPPVVTPPVIVTTPPVSGGTAPPAPSGGGVSPSPPGTVGGFSLSDEAKAKLGLTLTKEVTKWFLTPLDQPTMGLSPEAAQAWGDYKLGEQADYSAWLDQQSPSYTSADTDVVANSDVIQSLSTGEGFDPSVTSNLVDGTVDVVPVTADISSMGNLSLMLKGLGAAGALMDMGFTIAGNLPDAEKAVISALDTAIAVSLFVPVYGWAVALVLGIVRSIVGIFGGSIFGGGGMSHAQREALEVQYYAQQGLNPWMIQVAAALSPRELVSTLIRWTTGYCGGTSSVAIGVTLYNGQGDMVAIASPGCYANVGLHYHEWPDSAAMTLDDMAMALIKYPDEAHVSVQAGVAQSFLDEMNTAGVNLLHKRLLAWTELAAHGASLDVMDMLASEHRKTPHMIAVASYWGFADWHDLVGQEVQDDWTRYLVTNRNGSISDFARLKGYPDWVGLRDAIIAKYSALMDTEHQTFPNSPTHAITVQLLALGPPYISVTVPGVQGGYDQDWQYIPEHQEQRENPAWPRVLVPGHPTPWVDQYGEYHDWSPDTWVLDPVLLAAWQPLPVPYVPVPVFVPDPTAGGGGDGGL